MTQKNIAIVGATGLVGKTILHLLDKLNFPVKSLRLFASEESAGKTMRFKEKQLLIETLSAESFKNMDIVFFSVDSHIAKQFVPIAAKSGATVIDNSSAFRMDNTIPLIIPEINIQSFLYNGRIKEPIIANPNCSTIILLMGIYPILKLSNINKAIVSTYQAVSGAGHAAIDELEDQTRCYLNKEKKAPSVFPHSIAFNLFSHESKHNKYNENQEEAKLYHESKKILNRDIAISATCIRVPIFRVHTESVYLELENMIDIKLIRQSLMASPGIKIIDNQARHHFPMPIEASHQDKILIGRIRYDRTNPKGLWMMICGDQILKGAALNAVQIAQYC